MTEVGDGHVDVPAEVLLAVRCGEIGQNIVIGDVILRLVLAEAIGVLLKLHGLQLLVAHGDIDLGGVIDEVEVVVILHIAHVVVHIGAGVHGVEDLVPDVAEVQAFISVQIIHEGVGVIGIPFAGRAVRRCDGVCVIPGALDLLPDLVGIVEGHVPVVGGPGLAGLGLEVGAGLALVEIQIIINVVIIIVTGLAFAVDGFVSGLYVSQVRLPGSNVGRFRRPGNISRVIALRPIAGAVQPAVPIAAGSALVVFFGVVSAGERRGAGPVAVLTVEVGGAVGHQDQVLLVGRDVLVILQSFLTGQKTGVDVGAAGNRILHSGLYSVIACRKVEPGGLGSIALELHDAHVHGGAAVIGRILQIAQKGESLILHAFIGGRRTVQHKYHVGVQLFLCAGQGERHVRGPGLGVQGRHGFGFRDAGGVAGVVSGDLLHGQGSCGQNACQHQDAQQGRQQ